MMPRFACFAIAVLILAAFGCSEKDASSTAVAREPDAKKAVDMHDNPFPNRIKAPDLSGGVGWINTAGPLELEKLRGKFVILDFWTYCCINCMHILPELKKLEQKYPNELVVIGVHSAKFDEEADSKNITEAVLRYEIHHPVVNDARHAIWNRFGISSWPTMYLIDSDGYVIWGTRGETTFAALDDVMKKAVAYYRRKGLVDETPLKFDLAVETQVDTPLRYPGKVLADEASDRLFIADSNHNRLVVTTLDGKLIDTIGSGQIGAHDGDFTTATFNHPQGMALHGKTLYVADTENHLLRKIDLVSKTVKTIAGRGIQGRNAFPGHDPLHPTTGTARRWIGKPTLTALNSPWDVLVHDKYLYIAMAGPHQIWRMPLDESEIGPYAGNGREDIVDGPLLPPVPYEQGFSSFAQPSGLTTDGTWLYVADSEGSSIRAVPYKTTGKVQTTIGTSTLPDSRLFTFGDVDGDGDVVKLQHPLGVAWYEGKLYLVDTYNNKVKVIDIPKDTCTTVAGKGRAGRDDGEAKDASFDEPAGISAARGRLYVADTNNHLIRTIDLRDHNRVATLEIAGLAMPKTVVPDPSQFDPKDLVHVPAMTLRPEDGAVTIKVTMELPKGWKINPIAPTRYRVVPANASGPIDRTMLGKWVKLEPPASEFEIKLPAKGDGDDQVRVVLDYFYCQEGAEGLCKEAKVAWEVPVSISADAESSTTLLTTKSEK
jgi:thiol-disulfide isomerase/thioredoxin